MGEARDTSLTMASQPFDAAAHVEALDDVAAFLEDAAEDPSAVYTRHNRPLEDHMRTCASLRFEPRGSPLSPLQRGQPDLVDHPEGDQRTGPEGQVQQRRPTLRNSAGESLKDNISPLRATREGNIIAGQSLFSSIFRTHQHVLRIGVNLCSTHRPSRGRVRRRALAPPDSPCRWTAVSRADRGFLAGPQIDHESG